MLLAVFSLCHSSRWIELPRHGRARTRRRHQPQHQQDPEAQTPFPILCCAIAAEKNALLGSPIAKLELGSGMAQGELHIFRGEAAWPEPQARLTRWKVGEGIAARGIGARANLQSE